jgi:5-methylthioadenosine/S-adenosylhomocysteine deaminase
MFLRAIQLPSVFLRDSTTATLSERHNLNSSQSKSGDSGVKRARHAGACDVLVVVATFLFVTLSSVCARGGSYTLQGTLLTPNETIEGGSLTVHDSKIVQVGKGGAAEAGPIIEVHGVIMPGMIDLHDHITWNVIPRWKPGRLFGNRYEWEESAEYSHALKDPEGSLIDGGLGCDANLFGEVKALAGGATSIVGSYAGRRDHPGENACIEGLTRSLDFYPELGEQSFRTVAYEIFPFEVAPEQMDLYRHQLADGSLNCLLIHVAEGSPTDASAHREFKILKAQGLLRRGVAVIHGVAFRQEDFKDMAANGVSLVWSPRSNYELYGATTRIQEAKGSGVTIALAPDWSPTGSAGMLQELRYVADWNQRNKVFQDSELIEMTTSIPAEIAGFGDELGTLAPVAKPTCWF